MRKIVVTPEILETGVQTFYRCVDRNAGYFNQNFPIRRPVVEGMIRQTFQEAFEVEYDQRRGFQIAGPAVVVEITPDMLAAGNMELAGRSAGADGLTRAERVFRAMCRSSMQLRRANILKIS